MFLMYLKSLISSGIILFRTIKADQTEVFKMGFISEQLKHIKDFKIIVVDDVRELTEEDIRKIKKDIKREEESENHDSNKK